MSNLCNVLSTTHDLYVGSYELIGRAGSCIRDLSPASLSQFQKFISTIAFSSIERLSGAALRITLKSYEFTSRMLGRASISRATLLKKEMAGLENRTKSELFKLSKECSIVFDRSLIFSSIPTHEETQQVLEELYQFIENATFMTPQTQLTAARTAIASCFELNQIYQEIENLRSQEVTSEDCRIFQEELKRNILLTHVFYMNLENLGEFAGGLIVDESASLIPRSCNPAAIVGTKVCNGIAMPLGNLFGASLSPPASIYLLGKLPLMQFEDKRKVIQAVGIFLILAAEYYQLNPLSNFLEESVGQLGYNFSFYSVALLFNYLGMYLAGTNESLGSYVRNMTPSTLTYNCTDALLNYWGVEKYTKFTISTCLGSVAYNFDFFKSFVQGTLIEEELDGVIHQYTSETAQEGGSTPSLLMQELTKKLVSHQLRNQYRKNMTPSALTSNSTDALLNYWGVEKYTKLIISTCLSSVVYNFDLFKGLAQEALFEEEFDGIIDQYILRTEERISTPLLMQELTSKVIPRELLIHGIALFFREFGTFCAKLRTDRMKALLDDYKSKLSQVMHQTQYVDLDDHLDFSSELEEKQRRIFDELLGYDFTETERSFAIQLTQDLLNHLLSIDHLFLASHVEFPLNSQIEKFYPFVPRYNLEEEVCSTHIMGTLLEGFVHFFVSKLVNEEVNFQIEPLSIKRDCCNFLSNILEFIFEIRHPNHSTIIKRVNKKAVHLLIKSQLRELRG